MIARTTEVFTPTTPAHLTFVERAEQNEQLVDAINTPGKQIIVYGPSGSGKTTLLDNKLRQTYATHITSRCLGTTTFSSLLRSGFDQLNAFYVSAKSETASTGRSASLSADYLSIKAELSASRESQGVTQSTRVVPAQLTAERLAAFVGNAECCWVIEDFHKVAANEKAQLAQAMKVFMDAANDYPRLKVVAIGAVDTARQVIECETEMRNRVSEILVPLMTTDQLEAVVLKGEELLNVSFGGRIPQEIAAYSSGLASVCHQLCLNICFAAGVLDTRPDVLRITSEDLERAVERYLADSSDTLKAVWDKAARAHRVRKYDNCRIILKALVELPSGGATHAQILSVIHKTIPAYPAGNLTTYLRELRTADRGHVVSFDPYSSRFSFANPLYRAYGLLHFREELPKLQTWWFTGNFEKTVMQHLQTYTTVHVDLSEVNLSEVDVDLGEVDLDKDSLSHDGGEGQAQTE